MVILTLDNLPVYLNDLPDQITDDLRFAVLDNSDPASPDYFFPPLIFLESFSGPAAVLKIGPHTISIPLDWCVVIADPEACDMEVIPITSIAERGFRAFCFNPLGAFRPEFYSVDLVDIYQDVKWYFPKMRPGQILTMPLENKHNPMCAFFVKEVNKASELIDFCKAW